MRRWKVLSLNPPYGTLIAASERFPALGKHNETRNYAISYRGPLLIHQTKGLGAMFDSEEELWAFCEQEPFHSTLAALGYHDASELPRGAIVAAATLAEIAHVERCADEPLSGRVLNFGARLEELPLEPERSFGDYAVGRWAYRLTNIHALPEPIAARGLPGLWKWEGELMSMMSREHQYA